jgi:hypothetical protein
MVLLPALTIAGKAAQRVVRRRAITTVGVDVVLFADRAWDTKKDAADSFYLVRDCLCSSVFCFPTWTVGIFHTAYLVLPMY